MIGQVLAVTYSTVTTAIGATNSAAIFARCLVDEPTVRAMAA